MTWAAEVGQRLGAGKVAGHDEGERDRRVQMRTREVPGRVDHRHHDQPEDEGDPDRAKGAGMLGLGDDRAAAGEDQGEDADALRGGAPDQLGAPVHARLSSRPRSTRRRPRRTESSAPGTRLK